jgi:hypothetical protein
MGEVRAPAIPDASDFPLFSLAPISYVMEKKQAYPVYRWNRQDKPDPHKGGNDAWNI